MEQGNSFKTHLRPDCRKNHLRKCGKVVVLPSLHSVNHYLPCVWGHLHYSFNNQVTEEDAPVGVGSLNRPQGKVLPVVYHKPFQTGPGDIHGTEIVVRRRHNKKFMAIGSSNFGTTLSAGCVGCWWGWQQSSRLRAIFHLHRHRLPFVPRHNYTLPIGAGQRVTQLLKDPVLLADGQIAS